ncbi:ribonuclease HII [Candidatus Shapirobacteria bacterium CG10_big_fil_rev_8_21_14_0_10_40_9]|uniref:Ribonuclease n=1 Tax=Candidatus Shapirobacteria bacterium CG10_big_fil_rev_8_21_14_0_10_40_9 TaxID=1974888 RepID=A0A2M8L400_9BACT|nr:MAG: ribonuclease HII [Candidatus Shapirobacteria bacterium CG10_big_fil_rev_8_21_14_0_10_40_9]
MITSPDFSYEKKLWRKGFKFVVGIDEVGRGAWAGPLVVGAIIFAPAIKQFNNLAIEQLGINDSKLLKPRLREQLAKEIKKQALAWDVTEIGVGVINRIGIGKATEKAMRKTIRDIIRLLNGQMASSHFFVLVDFYSIPYLRGLGRKNQLGIKHGDQKSISIAAASILAKVHRDGLMRSLSRKYPQYGWGRNKGYGTRLQQKAILRCGLTRYHRKEFVKSWRKKLVVPL